MLTLSPPKCIETWIAPAYLNFDRTSKSNNNTNDLLYDHLTVVLNPMKSSEINHNLRYILTKKCAIDTITARNIGTTLG